jgi:hypothetical protein
MAEFPHPIVNRGVGLSLIHDDHVFDLNPTLHLHERLFRNRASTVRALRRFSQNKFERSVFFQDISVSSRTGVQTLPAGTLRRLQSVIPLRESLSLRR